MKITPFQFNQTTRGSFLPLKLVIVFIAGCIALLSTAIFDTTKQLYEEKAGGIFWRFLSDTTPEERITIVAIDEASIAQVGAWPWSRETLAQLSDSLSEYGASAQMFDIVFPEAKAGDAVFVEQLSQNEAIIAQIPVLDSSQLIRSGTLSGGLEKTRCQYPIPSASNYLANATAYRNISKGHITPIVDNDGVIRKQPPLICIDGRLYPSLALQGVLSNLENIKKHTSPSISVSSGKGLFSPDWQLSIDSYFGFSIPLDNQGNMRVSYHQAPSSFQVVSAVDILNNTAPRELIDGAWVLIGATAFGLGDVVPTPYNGATPGVELQARLLSSILDEKVPYTPKISNYIQLIEAIIGSLLLLTLGRHGNRMSAYGLPIATLAIPSGIVALHGYLLSYSVWLGWLTPALYSLILGALLTLAEHAIIRDERQRILGHLSSYLPKSVAHHLMSSMPSGAIEAHRAELVILSADLRNFSAYEESRPPEEAAALLHCFFVNATQIVESFGGQIEEYTGDAVLASWETSTNTATEKALEAATKLNEVMSEILPSRAPEGLEPLALGIGIERGPALVGSIGPAQRRTHTLLGDTVTIALRIQEMTQDLASPILIGECAARDIHGSRLISQGSFLLDGLRTPHVLFAPKLNLPLSNNMDESSPSLQLVRSARS